MTTKTMKPQGELFDRENELLRIVIQAGGSRRKINLLALAHGGRVLETWGWVERAFRPGERAGRVFGMVADCHHLAPVSSRAGATHNGTQPWLLSTP